MYNENAKSERILTKLGIHTLDSKYICEKTTKFC